MQLLKFEASWCQPCKILSRTLEQIALPCPVTVVDIDKDHKTAVEYGVRSVPTLILLDENHQIAVKIVGNKHKLELEETFSRYMEKA